MEAFNTTESKNWREPPGGLKCESLTVRGAIRADGLLSGCDRVAAKHLTPLFSTFTAIYLAPNMTSKNHAKIYGLKQWDYGCIYRQASNGYVHLEAAVLMRIRYECIFLSTVSLEELKEHMLCSHLHWYAMANANNFCVASWLRAR
jgi:hypothetical protein